MNRRSRVSFYRLIHENLDFAFFADQDGRLKKRYQKQIQELENRIQVNDNVEKTRNLAFLDPVRNLFAPDDIRVFLLKEGIEPESAYKGSLNVRLGSELHKRAAVYAISHQQSLNSFIEEAVNDKLRSVGA